MKSGSLIPPALFFFLNITLAIHGILCFHANVKIFFCSRSVQDAIGNFVKISLILWIALGNIVISTMLILPIQEHCITFHLFLCPY